MHHPRRVSSLLVTADLQAAGALYRDLGFTRVESDDPGCVGFVAGETGVILVDLAFARRTWSPKAVEATAGRCVPYVYLDRIEDDPAAAGEVLCDVRTAFGTREVVVRSVAGPIVLVERIAA